MNNNTNISNNNILDLITQYEQNKNILNFIIIDNYVKNSYKKTTVISKNKYLYYFYYYFICCFSNIEIVDNLYIKIDKRTNNEKEATIWLNNELKRQSNIKEIETNKIKDIVNKYKASYYTEQIKLKHSNT